MTAWGVVELLERLLSCGVVDDGDGERPLVGVDPCDHLLPPGGRAPGPRPGETHASREALASLFYQAIKPGPLLRERIHLKATTAAGGPGNKCESDSRKADHLRHHDGGLPCLHGRQVCAVEKGFLPELVGRPESQVEVSRSASRLTAASSSGRSLSTVAATIACEVSK